jgi:SAM-dependent methyltransferase
MRSGWNDYDTRFTDETSVKDYTSLYGKGGYDDHVWALERPVVLELLRREREKQGRLRLLDFACGTGRILRAVGDLADELTGVDISPRMAGRAALASPRAQIRTGCVLNDDLLVGTYDTVTIFRFFLNAPREIRLPILRKIRQHVQSGALLLINNHGHSPSMRSLAIRVPRARPQQPNELRHRDIAALLAASGFRIERRYGFSAFPSSLHLRVPSAALRRVDAIASAPSLQRLAGKLMIEQLYVARAVG